jgi:hypothetical protein
VIVDTGPGATPQISYARATKSGFSGEARAKAAAARKARKANPPRRDFLDAEHWAELAREQGVRLPQWATRCTTGGMTRWLRKLGRSVEWYRADSGFRTLQEWIDANPTWPLRAFVGLVLEEADDAH